MSENPDRRDPREAFAKKDREVLEAVEKFCLEHPEASAVDCYAHLTDIGFLSLNDKEALSATVLIKMPHAKAIDVKRLLTLACRKPDATNLVGRQILNLCRLPFGLHPIETRSMEEFLAGTQKGSPSEWGTSSNSRQRSIRSQIGVIMAPKVDMQKWGF